ncbi:MAG TPA: hypothetical protein VK137_15100 [Planctomycetaceae bacterium]|nr:hypothetical protein [Planctomycetaceae bacterium]
MKFTVVWSPQAEKELCELWLKSRNPADLARQVDAIERNLMTNADELGESREDGTRLLIVELIAVLFEVKLEDRKASVLHIESIPPLRPKPR